LNPIFIVGAPRSGTTLLRILLNRHHSIALCDETYYFYLVYTRRRSFGDLKDIKLRRLLVDRYLATNRIGNLGLDPTFLTETLMQEGNTYESFFQSLMRCYAREKGKTRFGEKTPHHALFSETLCEWYPECKLIHLVRDPRDVVASLLRMPWGSRSVLANARTWLTCTMGADRCSRSNNYKRIYYENLVSQPERELKEICDFLGEEYEPSMLDPDQKHGTQNTHKWWFQRACMPVTTTRRGKWVEQLSTKQISLVEWSLAAHMQQFGYEPSGNKASAINILAALIEEFASSVRQRIRKWPRLWYYWFQPTNLAAEEAVIDGNN